MNPSVPLLAQAAREALMVAVWVSLPLLAVAALVGLLVSVIQAVMQLQDSTLSHLPRLLAVAITLAALGPWMGRQIAAFAVRLLAGV
jgi:type III secretion HrpO family protein